MWINSYSQSTDFRGKKILIYTKKGKGYVHENIPTSVETLKKICASMGVVTVVSEDPALFTSLEINSFDAVIFSNTNNEAFDTEQQREAFKMYCQSGKGFGGIHSAIGSERKLALVLETYRGFFFKTPSFSNLYCKSKPIESYLYPAS